ncbi:hypothetical protein FQ087_21515 [Sporosarcina sp. ANT_H38]|uniref:LuxR C-terminal-related transcriptional regulator n=1 Tax=Sporosarcina sp. ANT_H38 TaxID=2597358 RepID=UPI0011F4038E|nr:LuxR C-terminal-related transcriptional regulator [Sporosarcina sp. ANT_H38]KAA0941027.1 hypothetical protein FQ087_21515 [Sporosarcina sp. ANT_H38]
MQLTLLNSKTTVPRAELEAIERQRLVDLLRYSGPKRLTVVRAPAGYGKTTLLSQWFSQSNEPVAWLSIDVIDNDPIRFWKYFVHTLSNTLPDEIDLSLLSLINEQSPYELLVDSLLNEINSLQCTIHIVIEDYHLIGKQSIHEMLIRFINYLPNNARMYVTSRTELPLPIAKWRVKAWLTEIGVEQLRFTYDEMERFYTKRRFNYKNSESLQHVFNMTEGWAAGIQLAGLSGSTSTMGEMDVDSFDGAHPFITEYLLQEILTSLPPSTQEFLVCTSILNQLEPAICDSLTKRTDSYHILLELEKSGLFIVRLHSYEPIFRYHHLFADALQIEMKNRYSQETISVIYKDTAIFLHGKGDFMSAIELALFGQLHDIADAWITAHLVEIFTSGETSTFTRWVQLLRDNNYPVNVETLVMNVITYATIHELEKANQLIEELESRHDLDQWMDHIDYQGMASILDSTKAFVLYASGGDLGQVIKIMQKQLERGPVSSRWDNIPMQYNRFEPTLLRTSIGVRGKLLLKETAIPLTGLFREGELKEQNMTGFSYGVSAENLYEGNYIDAASIELEGALQYGHHFKDPGLFIPMYILKGRIHATKKQFTAAHNLLDYAMETTQNRHWIGLLCTMKAHCYLLEGNVLQAEQQLYQSTGLNNPKAESGQEFWLLVQARVLLAKEQAEDALLIITRVKTKALQERQISTIVEAIVLEAICQMKLSHEEEALIVFHEALDHGAPYGYLRTFLDEADAIPLLIEYSKIRNNRKSAYWDSVPLAYVEQLIASIQDNLQQDTVNDILTPREQDVLQLLANGASNSEIAKQLGLSEGTVRVYLSKIYSKLDVNSRTKAVLWMKNREN